MGITDGTVVCALCGESLTGCEFRKPLIDLYLTILQADRESSLKKTQEIFKNMFDETL